jgi:hypothetical protein
MESYQMNAQDQIRLFYGGIGKEDISFELSKVLSSRPFRNSNQCSTLLRYIVDHTVSGEENLLRERVIGAELFGRPPDYETSEDPVVRLRVSEVRKRLAQYYLTTQDQQRLQIEIPSGGYRATFHWRAEPKPSAEHDPEPLIEAFAIGAPTSHALNQADAPLTELAAAPSVFFRLRRPIFSATILLVLAIVGSFAIIHANSPEKAFRAFWAPWRSNRKPVIISIGSNAVYRFKFAYLNRYAEQHGLKNEGQDFYVPLQKGETLSADDLFPAYNSFVALGDVAAVSRVVSTLTREGIPYQERFPDDVSFAELREDPSVLVGGFNNPLTLELTKQLEFVMRGGDEIIDTLDPKRKWQLDKLKDVAGTTDYAIITRIVRRDGDAPFIAIAGTGSGGTLAAAELICSPTNIHLITDRLPKDWAGKNFQAVVRINITDFKPSASGVVAFKSW